MRNASVILKFKKINTNISPLGRGEGVGHLKSINFSEFYRLCKQTPICVILISILIIVSSCSIKGYKPLTESEKTKIIEPYIFSGDFEKALYKTSIVIYGNNLTGLTLIKKTDSAIRVVSMSELGIKYFDFEFPFDRLKPAKVHYIMELLNKKPLVNMIKRDFNLLLFPPEIDKSDIKISDEDDSKMLVKHNKLIYIFNSSGAISEIAKQRTLKPMISLSGYEQHYPDKIYIEHGKISFDFEVIDYWRF